MSEYPIEGQEIELKYKIINYKGDVIDSTEGKPNFKFTLDKTKIIRELEDSSSNNKYYHERKTSNNQPKNITNTKNMYY